MTERILGEPGPTRRRRLRLLLPLLALTVLIVVLGAPGAGALDTTNPPAFTYVKDEDCSKTPACADDQPGQKDLSAHAVANPTPNDLWVSWKWDVTSLSGGNTGDACALFDTDQSGSAGIGRVDFSICVTIGGSPAAQLTALSPRIYTCGDAKVDRCTSAVVLVPKVPNPYGTACSVQQIGIDNSDPWHSGQTDTVAVCHVDLADVGGAASSKLINTCSYPSEQPNSDPSDCVLIPRDAFLKIIKSAGGDTSNFNFSVSGGATATPTIAGGSNETISIKSSTSTNVTETLPSAEWEFVSANCLNGAGAAVGTLDNTAPDFGRTGFTAASDETITCTFTNALKAAPQLKITKSCVSKHAAADRFQPQNNSVDVGAALDCGESTTISLSPNTAYSITEVGSAGADLANYETPSYSSACGDLDGLARGAATPECTITNTLKAAPQLKITKSCVSKHAAADRFQPQNNSVDVGAALDCGESTTISLSPNTAYSITEVGSAGADLANYETPSYSSACGDLDGLARGAATPECTITNTLKAAPQLKITKSCVSKHAAADRFQPQNNSVDVGAALDCGESTTISLSPNTAYSITEVGSAGADLANYETPSYSSACGDHDGLARGAATPECTITNTLKLFKLIVIVCDGAELHSSAVTLPQGQNSTNTLGAAPAGVNEAALCGSAGASYSRKSGTYSPEVVINP